MCSVQLVVWLLGVWSKSFALQMTICYRDVLFWVSADAPFNCEGTGWREVKRQAAALLRP